ncbi:MAG: protease inhibitor I42 family protein [Victivallales bacterium]|nr:protease inhibitor I42 family protein [Victivallales bacterium]
MKTLLLLCLMFSFFLGCNSTIPPAPDTPSSDTSASPAPDTPDAPFVPVVEEGNRITVTQGQTFTIAIPGNITTGFIWRQAKVNENQSIVSTIGEDYRTPPSKVPACGAPGTHYFTFHADAVGECDLVFENLRPWEEDVEPLLETYHITVQ